MASGKRAVAIACFALFIVALHAFIVFQAAPATLTIEMRSDVASRARAFFDTGQGFREAESDERWLPGGPDAQVLHFAFPAKTVRAIRFDPLHNAGEFEVRSIFVERSDNHQVIRTLDVSRISTLDQSASEGTNNAQLLLPVDDPIAAGYSARQIFSLRILVLDALVIFSVLGLLGATRYAGRPISVLSRVLDKCSQRLSQPGVFEVDRIALLFYAVCLIAFVVLSLAKVHGSSVSMAGNSYQRWTDVSHTPLLGTPRRIRSDEWAFHTPAILNQVLRQDKLAVADSSVGPGNAALLANLPCRHFTQLFRPQFWSFFVLPVDFAFSFYWQGKALLLLTGVFTLLLLLSRSSVIAVIGSLWYFFSAYTQWAYSWASLLPEMVGLFGWIIFLSCYLLVGQNKGRLLLAALLWASCVINFALCAYPPHQIPLVIIGIAIIAWWLWSHHGVIWTKKIRPARALALGSSWALAGAVMLWFYFDARETLLVAAHTIYPGQRLSSGGDMAVSQLFSHFLDFWKAETNFPPAHGNVCESSGYLWLAPLTLLGGAATVSARQLRICLWTAFVFILAWMLIPIPASVGHWAFFDRVPSYRCLHALGLINIALVSVFLAQKPAFQALGSALKRSWLTFAAGGVVGWLVFYLANRNLDYFFSRFALLTAALYVSLLALLLLRRQVKAFAVTLLLPLAFANGLINPIDRGLDVVTESSLFKAAQADGSTLRRGKWLIYAAWADQSSFLGATGIEVFDCLKIVPDLPRLARFDPEQRFAEVINRSCYLAAIPLARDQPSSFAPAGPGNVLWRVGPFDPRLREIGVEHVAFAHCLPKPELEGELAPHLETDFPFLKVYHVP